MRVQRAEYEASLAQRRYEEVDPSNRLVASTLEKRWNDALSALAQVRQQHHEFVESQHISMTPEERRALVELAQDLPRLWKEPTTQAKDKKRLLRLLIKDITVEKIVEARTLTLHIRWQGGATENLSCALRRRACDAVRYDRRLVERIKTLAATMDDDQIPDALNTEGFSSSKGGPFTMSKVRNTRFAYRIHAPDPRHLGELSVKEVADNGVCPLLK
jgi:hypothetical protein